MCDMVDISLGDNKEVLPPKNKKIALIDADTIVFAACTMCEYEESLLPREMYSDTEWTDIIVHDGYSEEDNCIYDINLDEAYDHAMNKIETILELTGCSTYELHFTSGRKSFRYNMVNAEYKSNRTGSRAPYGIAKVKKLMGGTIHYEWEADDIVVALKRDNPDKYIMCAVDKDLLYSLPGKHFNYYKSVAYGIDMKWIEVNEITALKHHYLQTLTGDPTDGIIGLKGIGPKKAAKLLDGLTTELDMWEVVVREYDKVDRVLDAILNMRLVNMHQVKLVDGEYKVVLWKL